uniref:Uncharacterized protein LOC102808334 n=1 Tax=Saccoglossus kowalevskii TaxID=10224 RepID=A0ABM0M2G9_SACKO|nr:PREDICTED: uncharacterized protein LOC102808334 [Saccoglossus kowalevskii]
MATGHILPGYKDPVSRFRSKSADPTMTGYRYRNVFHSGIARNLDPHILEEIKDDAYRTWNEELKDWSRKPSIRPTTYSHTFYKKTLDEPTQSRPTEVTRRNKPHPPLVFLSCRLKTVPGFHDPDAVTGKEVYRSK